MVRSNRCSMQLGLNPTLFCPGSSRPDPRSDFLPAMDLDGLPQVSSGLLFDKGFLLRVFLLRQSFLSLSIAHSSNDGNHSSHNLCHGELLVHEDGFNANDGKLIHVDEDQETGCTNETLCPDSRVADSHTNNAAGSDPEVACCCEALNWWKGLPFLCQQSAQQYWRETQEIVQDRHSGFRHVYWSLISRQHQALKQTVTHSKESIEESPARSNQFSMRHLPSIHCAASEHEKDRAPHACIHPDGLWIETFNGQAHDWRATTEHHNQRHGCILQGQHWGQQHSAEKRRHHAPAEDIIARSDVNVLPGKNEQCHWTKGHLECNKETGCRELLHCDLVEDHHANRANTPAADAYDDFGRGILVSIWTWTEECEHDSRATSWSWQLVGRGVSIVSGLGAWVLSQNCHECSFEGTR